MKKSILLFVLLTTLTAYAQVAPTMEVLRKPTFRGDIRQFTYTGSALYLCGYDLSARSFVAKSTDLGANWQILEQAMFNASDNLNGISFSGNTGIVVGSGGKMYRSTDGGVTWVNKTDSSIYSGGYNEVQFLSANIAYACGGATGSTQVLKTTNAGETWIPLVTGQTNTMYDMHWDNELTGWVAGSSQRIVRTTDGGATWTLSTTPATSTLYSIKRASASVFYAAGTAGSILKSVDNGVTFTALTSPTTLAIYTIETFSENELMILGSSGMGYKSTDGGSTWTALPAFTTEVIRTSIKAGGKIIAGAYKSTIAESVNGTEWNVFTNDYRDFYGIFQDGNRIAVVGDRGGVHLSTDNGVTWKAKTFLLGNIMYDAYMSGNNFYVCGRAGNYFVSTDAGNTWQNKSIGTSTTRLYKLFFFNSNEGYTVTNEGNILYTTNGGSNWQTQATFTTTTLYDIKMLNTTTGFASGSGQRLFATTNGTTWSHGSLAQPSGQMTGIYLVDNLNGYVCGENGAIYKTTDGFNTLTLISDTIALQGKVVHDVLYFGPGEVWAVAQGGLVLRMNTQGQMVVVANSLYGEDLTAMYRSGPSSFIASGYSGTVYRFSFTPVPVELISFGASVTGNDVILNWITATETNNKGFHVERSGGAGIWERIAFVKGAGTATIRSVYKYIDHLTRQGKYSYRLVQEDYDGSLNTSKQVEAVAGVVTDYSLSQNYPNPFNPATTISFSLAADSKVSLKVYDILGNEVMILAGSEFSAGTHNINFDASSLTSGVYLYR
ncbi:MAG: T9SS type A sorting domain-containing protein, partial [Ignavibacteriaceae bacterium]|nr:T9SS type A sorting domain-containing protein [Ignavibacteriaceae bacterium]